MPSVMSSCLLLLVLVPWPATLAQEPVAPPAPASDPQSVASWIAQWDRGDFFAGQHAKRELIAIGEPAVPSLIALIQDGSPKLRLAVDTLCEMGPPSESALPLLIQIARDRSHRDPQSWTGSWKAREYLVHALERMGWAAETLVPALGALAEDPAEDPRVRRLAAASLRGMGKAALPVLARLQQAKDDELRLAAHRSLAAIAGAGHPDPAYFLQLAEQDPFDPNVRRYLLEARGAGPSREHLGAARHVKQALRERLRTDPDPEMALGLALIIEDQLAHSELGWTAPATRGRIAWPREDASENHATLAAALELGFQHAVTGSPAWRRCGVALAKLDLLRGDFASMNARLAALGQTAIADEERAWLAAPPKDWSDLHASWQRCDASLRSGDCGVTVRIEKDGRGLEGVHVLVKEAPPESRVHSTGIEVATILHEPQALSTSPWPEDDDSFGYRAKDRSRTRYAVTGASGEVTFERLPKVALQLQVLVPTGNFWDAAPGWDLCLRAASGEEQRTIQGMMLGTGGRPPVIAVESGKTTRYPTLVVRPRFPLGVPAWQQVDPAGLVLAWHGLDEAPASYELTMTLSCPDRMSKLDPESLPSLRTTRQVVAGTEWPIGEQGVGGMHLRPGNLYAFEVAARDARGTIIARWGRTPVWVPWDDRATAPPGSDDVEDAAPIGASNWHSGTFGFADGRTLDLEQRVPAYLAAHPDAFEADYVRVLRGWLDWRAGHRAEARAALDLLAHGLPRGNVAQATAAWIVAQIDSGREPEKSLDLVVPQD